MTANTHYPPVTVPGTVHALRHLPFLPASLEGEFHALAAFHLLQAEDEHDAELMLNTHAIKSGWRYHDHFTVYKFFKDMTK